MPLQFNFVRPTNNEPTDLKSSAAGMMAHMQRSFKKIVFFHCLIKIATWILKWRAYPIFRHTHMSYGWLYIQLFPMLYPLLRLRNVPENDRCVPVCAC